MTTVENSCYGGERPFFGAHDLKLVNVTIQPGESALKNCSNIVAEHCRFEGKYPFWHVNNFVVKNCEFTEGARAALWYSRNLQMSDTLVDAPKMFREMEQLQLSNVTIPNALETLWHCNKVTLNNVRVDHADYLFFHCNDIKIDNYRHNGNYSFQYCNNVVIRNAVINSKDAFWNTHNVTIIDSEINGEYLGWHSHNLHLINCRISGTQPLCYAHNLVMEHCTMGDDCDLAFEDSTLNAVVDSHIVSIKNPSSGVITAQSVGERIFDEFVKAPANCVINTL